MPHHLSRPVPRRPQLLDFLGSFRFGIEEHQTMCTNILDRRLMWRSWFWKNGSSKRARRNEELRWNRWWWNEVDASLLVAGAKPAWTLAWLAPIDAGEDAWSEGMILKSMTFCLVEWKQQRIWEWEDGRNWKFNKVQSRSCVMWSLKFRWGRTSGEIEY